MSKDTVLKEFRQIPGVGNAVSEDLWNLGFRSVSQLKGRDPEKMYDDLCILQGCKVDMCMKYVFRCAVYYASNDDHDPNLLKWWNWKNRKIY